MSSSLSTPLPATQLLSVSGRDLKALAKNISEHIRGGRLLAPYYQYAKWKLRTDPLYGAVRSLLKDSPLPVLDIGCGIGLLGFYLRESGTHSPLYGVDFDEAKIRIATKVAERYTGLHFQTTDVRHPWPEVQGNLCLLDVLQYLSSEDGAGLLERSAAHVAPGGVLIIRSPLQENTWRGTFTRYTDRMANIVTWMKAAPKHYPTREELVNCLAPLGLHLRTSRPLWGRTPFNTHLLVFERPEPGSTQV